MEPQKIAFISQYDGKEDYYMLELADRSSSDCLIVIHGHNSHGDQLYTRKDVMARLPFIRQRNLNIISPNLRDNAWMSPAAAADLRDILLECRQKYGFKRYVIVAGSMGGTSALIFAVLHSELIDGVAVLGAVSDIKRYVKWCRNAGEWIHNDIADAIEANYDDQSFAAHNVCAHADKLTMPLRYFHGESDRIMPVSEMYALEKIMQDRPNARFQTVPDGDHDSPLAFFESALQEILTLSEK